MVAAQRVPQPAAVAHEKRVVQPQLDAQGLKPLGVASVPSRRVAASPERREKATKVKNETITIVSSIVAIFFAV